MAATDDIAKEHPNAALLRRAARLVTAARLKQSMYDLEISLGTRLRRPSDIEASTPSSLAGRLINEAHELKAAVDRMTTSCHTRVDVAMEAADAFHFLLRLADQFGDRELDVMRKRLSNLIEQAHSRFNNPNHPERSQHHEST